MLIECVSPACRWCLFCAQTASNVAQRHHREGLPFSVLYYSALPAQNCATLDMHCARCVHFLEVQRANFLLQRGTPVIDSKKKKIQST